MNNEQKLKAHEAFLEKLKNGLKEINRFERQLVEWSMREPDKVKGQEVMAGFIIEQIEKFQEEQKEQDND